MEGRKERKNSKTFQAEGATQRFSFTLAAFLALQPYSFLSSPFMRRGSFTLDRGVMPKSHLTCFTSGYQTLSHNFQCPLQQHVYDDQHDGS
jgi:hypothetical protein